VVRWLIPILFLVVACGPDPELTAEKQRLEQQVVDLEKANTRLEHEADGLHAKVRKLQETIDHLELRETLRSLGLTEGQKLSARLETSKGDITCELWSEKAPNTVINFVQIAEGTREWTDPRTDRKTTAPLYNGTIFHRVIPEFMIQGGDPLGDGRGGPGYQFADEISSDTKFDEPGLLAMANSGPDTNGSQFFITDRSTPHNLDGKHTIFGKCDHQDVVQAIATVDVGARNRPKKDVVLERVRIVRE